MRAISTKYLWLTVSVAGLVLLFQPTGAAGSYTFQGFPGGWSPAFFDQSAVVPCHATVSVKLSAARYDHHDSDVPIAIEFRAPGVSLQSEPTHIRIFQARLGDTRSETFTAPGHDTGCGSPWRVRIVPNATSTRDGRIVGDLSVSFVSNAKTLNVEDAATLANGRSTTKNIGDSNGLHQGRVEITGTWNHSVFGVPGPLPVKLNFELLKPDGSIAAYDTGHSKHEINPCCSGDKLKVRLLVREHISGQWKLRIRNDSGNDAMALIPRATFVPACP